MEVAHDTAALLAQLTDLKQLLRLQNSLLLEQTREIAAQKAHAAAARNEIDIREQRIARLERHLALKGKKDASGLRPSESTVKLVNRKNLNLSAKTLETRPTTEDVEGCYREVDRIYGFVDWKPPEREEVLVPAWREGAATLGRGARNGTGSVADVVEDVGDEAFERRHRKYEQLEKRRKRADREQALLALQQEETANYLGVPQPSTRPATPTKPFSFFPDPYTSLKVIEVTDKLPLVAWGRPVPHMDAAEFSLPRTGDYSFETELDFASFRHRGKEITPLPTPDRRLTRHSHTRT